MVYKLMPRRYKRWLDEMFRLLESKTSPEKFTNYAFAISLAIGFLLGILSGTYFIPVWIAIFISIFILFHGFIILAVDKRARFVEEILPDALQLMAANMRAGYITSRALLLSARSEFGPLSDAIKKAGKEIMTGKSVEEGLAEIPKQIRSEDLKRTINLIIEGIKSGGEIMTLLEENAEDMRRRQALKKEIKASITMYVIFIIFAGCLAAPILYALSGYLINTIADLGKVAKIPEGMTANVPFAKFGVHVSVRFLFEFSIIAILITSIFNGLIIGLLDTGKEKAGIKYIPILVIISLLAFFGANFLINNVFGAMLPRF